jgi:hypothetical protein
MLNMRVRGEQETNTVGFLLCARYITFINSFNVPFYRRQNGLREGELLFVAHSSKAGIQPYFC